MRRASAIRQLSAKMIVRPWIDENLRRTQENRRPWIPREHSHHPERGAILKKRAGLRFVQDKDISLVSLGDLQEVRQFVRPWKIVRRVEKPVRVDHSESGQVTNRERLQRKHSAARSDIRIEPLRDFDVSIVPMVEPEVRF